MRASHLAALSSSPAWYEWTTGNIPAQHPTMWRFIIFGYFTGSASFGIPSETGFSFGWGVFDWDYVTNKYELTRFTEDSESQTGTAYAWVNDTEVRIVRSYVYDSSQDTVRHAGKILVATSGAVTLVEPVSTHCGNDLVNDADFWPGFTMGYNGAVIYSYADGAFSPSPTNNCYIGKITSTNSATNLGPLRTGLTAGAQFAPLCPLGITAAGNGFAVCVKNCSQDYYASQVQTGLINVGAATPSLTANLTYTGRPNTFNSLHIGARKVLVTDYHDSTYNGKVTLLYTNSDTAPTSLSQGASAFAPTMPFRSADVKYAYPSAGGFCCQNMWVSEGKSAGLVIYNLDKNLAAGETQRYYYLPCKYTSSGASDIAVTLLNTDINGAAVPVDTWWNSEIQSIDSYAFNFVGGPGNKAALFWRLGNGTHFTVASQTVFQL